MNQMYGFEGEVKAKYTAQMFQLFSEVFQWLPLAQCINNKVLVSIESIFMSPTSFLIIFCCCCCNTSRSSCLMCCFFTLHARLCMVDCSVKTASLWKTSGRLTETDSLQTQVVFCFTVAEYQWLQMTKRKWIYLTGFSALEQVPCVTYSGQILSLRSVSTSLVFHQVYLFGLTRHFCWSNIHSIFVFDLE